jgi:CBS domain-containing protein
VYWHAAVGCQRVGEAPPPARRPHGKVYAIKSGRPEPRASDAMKEPLFKSVMTPFPYAVELTAPLGEARALMLEHHVRHLPVTSDHELRGLITDRDIKLLLGPELGSPDPRKLTVEDAYISDCFVVDLDYPLREVLRNMAERHIGAAVVTAHGRLAGIFTATDACRAFAHHLDEQFHPGEDEPPDVA